MSCFGFLRKLTLQIEHYALTCGCISAMVSGRVQISSARMGTLDLSRSGLTIRRKFASVRATQRIHLPGNTAFAVTNGCQLRRAGDFDKGPTELVESLYAGIDADEEDDTDNDGPSDLEEDCEKELRPDAEADQQILFPYEEHRLVLQDRIWEHLGSGGPA